MSRVLALALACIIAAPEGGRAEESPAPPGGEVDRGFSLIEEGARLIMRRMLREMEPALGDMRRDLGAAFDEWGPAMAELARKVGDLSAYHAPEVLPNGDILIRRKRMGEGRDPGGEPGQTFGPDGETDL